MSRFCNWVSFSINIQHRLNIFCPQIDNIGNTCQPGSYHLTLTSWSTDFVKFMRCFCDYVSFSSTMKPLPTIFGPHIDHGGYISNAFVAKFWPHFHGILTVFAITWRRSSVVNFTFKFSPLKPRNQTWLGWPLCYPHCVARVLIIQFKNDLSPLLKDTQHNINNGQLDSEKKFKAQQDIYSW